MTLNSTLSDRAYGITIDIPEGFVEKLISRGEKPSQLISSMIRRISSEIDLDSIVDYSNGKASLYIGSEDSRQHSTRGIASNDQEWTYDAFVEFMNSLISLAERRASVGDLLSMLVAYYDTNSRPTSEELREARGFGPGQKWYEELRTARARLTIAAKHMGLPSFYLRAYGSGMKRRHPMNQKIYGFLSRWGSEYLVTIDEYRQLATPRSID